MAASFLHGVEIIEVLNGPVSVSVVASAVIGLVGTAPSWAVVSPIVAPPPNTPTLVGSQSAAQMFGPMIQGYSIPYALAAIQEQGAPQVIVVNVFNQAIHFTDLVEQLTFNAAGAINLGHMGISNLTVMATAVTPVTAEADTFAGTPGTVTTAHSPLKGGTVVVTNSGDTTTYVEGTDYTVDYRTGMITRLTTGAITAAEAVKVTYDYYSGTVYLATASPADYTVDLINGVVNIGPSGNIAADATVAVAFSYADPSKVQDSDIIGGVSGGVYTGISALQTTFGTMGLFAKILIAPGYSKDPSVASALTSMAGTIRAMALIDSPPLTSVATAIANRGAGGNAFNTSSKRAILCFPNIQFTDIGLVPTGVTLSASGTAVPNAANATEDSPYSQWVAGAIAAQDLENGYWYSPSSTEIDGILGPDVVLYTSPMDPNCDTNDLNAAGILTVFAGFATGPLVWGNRSAAYPTFTTPDVFIPVRRTMDIVEMSVQLAQFQFLDQPISNALITAILQSVNGFINSLIGKGALIGGSCSYNPAENTTAITMGQLIFDLTLMPPTPAERITFNTSLDPSLLATIGTTQTAVTTPAT